MNLGQTMNQLFMNLENIHILHFLIIFKTMYVLP